MSYDNKTDKYLINSIISKYLPKKLPSPTIPDEIKLLNKANNPFSSLDNANAGYIVFETDTYIDVVPADTIASLEPGMRVMDCETGEEIEAKEEKKDSLTVDDIVNPLTKISYQGHLTNKYLKELAKCIEIYQVSDNPTVVDSIKLLIKKIIVTMKIER